VPDPPRQTSLPSLRTASSQQATAPRHTKQPPPSRPIAAMLLLDYQNVLIESLLRDRIGGCEQPRDLSPAHS
jgi:hypothetical protein